MTLLGFIPAQGRFRAPLEDPDDDGVYAGSITVPRLPPGPRPVPPGVEPVSLPVQIAQESGGNLKVIRDFGVVSLTGDRTFKASQGQLQERRYGNHTGAGTRFGYRLRYSHESRVRCRR